jgi:hypothetical protein
LLYVPSAVQKLNVSIWIFGGELFATTITQPQKLVAAVIARYVAGTTLKKDFTSQIHNNRRTSSSMEQFLNALDDLIAETEGPSVIEIVGSLELAKNDIIAGRYDKFNNGAVTPQHGLISPKALLEFVTESASATDPIERIDMSSYCTSRERAINTAKYIVRMRR